MRARAKKAAEPVVHPMATVRAEPRVLKRAAFRVTPEDEPILCEVLSRKGGKVVLREIGRPLSGVWSAREDQISPPPKVDAQDFAIWLNINLRQMGLIE